MTLTRQFMLENPPVRVIKTMFQKKKSGRKFLHSNIKYSYVKSLMTMVTIKGDPTNHQVVEAINFSRLGQIGLDSFLFSFYQNRFIILKTVGFMQSWVKMIKLVWWCETCNSLTKSKNTINELTIT